MNVFVTATMRDVPDVDTQPSFDLEDWAVISAKDGTRFLVGKSANGSSLRVSTPLVEFDDFSMTGVTSSGRRYRLVGEQRPDPLADLAFTAFTLSQGMSPDDLAVVEFAGPPTLRN